MNGLLLSASAIKRYAVEHEGCQRSYALRYVAGLPDPGSPATALGKDVDDNQIQPYLTTGKPFDYSKDSGHIAAAGLAYYPKPGTPGMQVQHKFVLPSPSGLFSYLGFKDTWLPEGGLPSPPPGVGAQEPMIVDYKTTKAIGSWALTETTLGDDVQAMLYAANAFWELRKAGRRANRVHLVWLYLQTQGARKAKRVWRTVDGEHVGERLMKIDAIGREIAALRARADEADVQGDAAIEWSLSLKPNPAACGKFGGCPYRHVCNLSPAEQFGAEFTEPMDAKRRLPVVGAGEGDKVMGMSLQERLAAKKAKADAAAQPPTSGSDAAAQPADDFIGVNPPEKNLPPAPPVGSVAVQELPVMPVEIVTEKPKRGRPKKEKAVELTANAEGVFEAPAPSELDAAINELIAAATSLGAALRKVANVTKKEAA